MSEYRPVSESFVGSTNSGSIGHSELWSPLVLCAEEPPVVALDSPVVVAAVVVSDSEVVALLVVVSTVVVDSLVVDEVRTELDSTVVEEPVVSEPLESVVSVVSGGVGLSPAQPSRRDRTQPRERLIALQCVLKPLVEPKARRDILQTRASSDHLNSCAGSSITSHRGALSRAKPATARAFARLCRGQKMRALVCARAAPPSQIAPHLLPDTGTDQSVFRECAQ